MGGKSSQSTQTVSIPPEILARYNAVNARAETTAQTPFQQYSTNPADFVAPLTSTQQAGIANTNYYSGAAQPYYQAATGQLASAQQAAVPYYGQATQNVGEAQNVGNTLAGGSLGALAGASAASAPYYGQATQNVGQAQNVGNALAGGSLDALAAASAASSPYYGQANQNIANAQNAGNTLAYGSLGALGGASAAANPLQQQAQAGLAGAFGAAQPFNMAAAGQYLTGLQQGQDFSQMAYGSGQQALRGAQPFQGMATQYMGAGAQAVNPMALGADQINQYMSPYLSTVLQGTAGLQNQMNQQAMAGQTGNAIRSGAFGGDRAGIAAANLAQQQQLANSKIFSDILNQGYGQALGTAQQQQQLGLGAEQANRAALQQAAQQSLAIGQQGFGQGLSAAQQQAALGQQLYGMGAGAGQNLASLGQQIYGQGTGTAQQQAALAQQLFGQGSTAAQQIAGLGQQQFGQGMTAAQQQAAMGQQLFGQGATTAQQIAGLGQQQFGQGMTAAQQNAALGQQLFGQGATTAQQLAGLGQQQFGQGMTAAQQNAALGQGLYGMGANTSQQLAALGQGAQGAGLQGSQAQLAAGQAQQQTEQAGLQALYNQFLQQQSYPFQTAQFLANIAMGTGALSGSTTQTNQAGGGFSDRRLKENIRPVGKTFDGQTIYSYNFKGEPQTEIGLIAQEVEKKHPEAVGLAGGYKTVHYGKATDDAADRGHFAYGGSAMGGGVMPQHAGEGFYNGGDVGGFDPGLMQQILASYQQMYAPISAPQNPTGGLGAAGFVPAGNLPVGSLQTAGELPAMRDPMANAANAASIGKSVGEIGGKIGAWKWGEEEEKDPDRKDLPKEFSDGEWRRGGRTGLAGGGVPTEISIPNEKEKVEVLKPAAAPEPPKDNTADLIKTAAQIAMMAAANGGRIGYAAGGTPYGNDGGYLSGVLEEQNKIKPPELMTAGNAPGQGPGFLDKAAKGAGLVKNVLGIGKMLGISDRRAKENIRPVGKTFDGQTVYSFNYKGDKQTQMGLIAQEVEKRHPSAVGTAGGMKTVNYKKATGPAAKRGHFAEGGVAGFERMGEAEEPDFNLDPEDIIAGGDQEFEALLRPSPRQQMEMPKPAGLGALEQSTKEFADRIAYKPEPLAAGLAPTMAPSIAPKAMPKVMPTTGGSGVRSVRNNNPGNIEDGSFAKRLPGYAGGDGRFAIFKNPNDGRSAQMTLIRSYINRGFDTPWKIASRWAPPTEKGNDTPMYAKKIAQMAGVGVHDRVSASVIPQIANAQTFVEGGQKALQHFLPGKSEGGLIGRHGYQTAGFVNPEDEQKPVGLAAAETPATDAAPPVEDIVVNAKPKKPENILPELPQRGISYGQGKEQKPAYFGGSNIPGYRYDYMTEPFFKGLKKGTASSWIPLLTGLGTFATTPTRSVLSGLLAGAGAGAQTYASLANERNKQIPTRQAAEARYGEATQNIAGKIFVPLGGGRYYHVPTRKVLTQDQYQNMLRNMVGNNAPGFFPEAPESAPVYQPSDAIIKPPSVKPVMPNIKPDTSTPAGIYASAYMDPIVTNAREKVATARSQIKDINSYLSDPSVMANPQAQQSIGGQMLVAQTQLTDATSEYDKRLAQLTGVPLQTLSETQRSVFNNTIERAASLAAEQQSLRPVMLAFSSLKGDFGGGTAQGTWARIADFAKGFMGLSDESAAALAQNANANARLQVLQQFFPGAAGVFDPNNPGAALESIYKNYLQPRYQDLNNQIKEIKPFTQPSGAPGTSVGVNPSIAPPPAPAPQSTPRAVRGRDNIWRGASEADINNNSSIKKGDRYRVPDGKGGWIEGVKQ